MGTGTVYNDTTTLIDFPLSFSNIVRIVGTTCMENSGNYVNDCYFKQISLTQFCAVTSINAGHSGKLPFSYIAIGY